MKRRVLIAIAIVFIFFLLPINGLNFTNLSISATYDVSLNSEEDIATEEDLQEEVQNQLDGLDFSSIEKLIAEFSQGQLAIFGNASFLSKLMQLISGDFDNGQGFWKSIATVFFDNLLNLLPYISIIVAVSLLGSMLQGLKPTTNGKSISNVIHFVTYGIIVVLVLSIVIRMIALTSSTISSLKGQMDGIFPILLTFLTAIGGTTSASVYQPAMTLLTGTIVNILTNILLPIFIFSVVFSVVSNLSNTIKLDKFTSFFNSTFKWITGLIFTIFSAFLSIQGVTAGTIDGISIRTAKYAIRSYVPILGSYLSDGMGLILASSNLIKNAVGATGLFMLLATILAPLIEMMLFMLMLKLVAGIIEPLGNSQVANFISSLSKSMVLLVVLLIAVGFVYFIMLGLVMCSANVV
ncbi:MAG: hypothetical protein J6C53_01040 [Clostridia bacterium]|nr:hypothetical protein [Clostridia bacterium]